jgi:hypothetical protein
MGNHLFRMLLECAILQARLIGDPGHVREGPGAPSASQVRVGGNRARVSALA